MNDKAQFLLKPEEVDEAEEIFKKVNGFSKVKNFKEAKKKAKLEAMNKIK